MNRVVCIPDSPARILRIVLLCGLFGGCAWMPFGVRPSAEESTRFLDEARQAWAAGERERTRQLLVRAAEVAPNDPEIQRGIGEGFLRCGDADEGIRHVRFAIRRGLDDPDAYVALANVLLDAGKDNECRDMVNAALQLVPTHWEAQLLKARLAERKGNDDDALEIYYCMLANDPFDAEAALRVSEVLLRMDRARQAAPLLRTVVDSDRVTPEEQAKAHWMLGVIYGHDQRWAAAASELAAGATRSAQLSADECYRVAYAFWEAGDRDKAGDYVSRALSINPAHADALALATACHARESASPTAYAPLPLPAPTSWQ